MALNAKLQNMTPRLSQPATLQTDHIPIVEINDVFPCNFDGYFAWYTSFPRKLLMKWSNGHARRFVTPSADANTNLGAVDQSQLWHTADYWRKVPSQRAGRPLLYT